MKQNLIIFAVAFAGALGGANVQPLLSGVGKIIFPENATPATISASGGALTLAAGGTPPQNIILAPSGTGVTSSASPLYVNPGVLPAYSQFLAQSNTAGAIAMQSLAADNAQLLFDAYRSGGSTLAANATAARLIKNAAHARLQYTNGQSVGGTIAAFTAGWDLDLANGNGGFGGNTTPGFAVDATGDINASATFKQGGTTVIDASRNVIAGAGGNTVLRCATGGTLPAGTLTITGTGCGTTADTGFRAK